VVTVNELVRLLPDGSVRYLANTTVQQRATGSMLPEDFDQERKDLGPEMLMLYCKMVGLSIIGVSMHGLRYG
jgi:hypothetical protein